MPGGYSIRFLSWLLDVRAREPADENCLRLVRDYVRESHEAFGHGNYSLKPADVPAGRMILEADPKQQVAYLLAAYPVLDESKGWRSGGSWLRWEAAKHLISQLLRRKLPYEERDVRVLIVWHRSYLSSLPTGDMLRAVDRYVKDHGMSASLRLSLLGFYHLVRSRLSRWAGMEEATARVERILGYTRPIAKPDKPVLLESVWETPVHIWLGGQDATVRDAWAKLLRHAQVGNRSQPSATWLKGARGHVCGVGEEAAARQLMEWLGEMEVDPWTPDPNTDTIKGLIWATAAFEDGRLASMVGRLCEQCFKKIPGAGAKSMKLGNACLHALGVTPGERGVAELVRVRGRMKYVQARQQLEKALAGAAERAGLSVADLEEIALPDFGLGPDGSLTETLGDATAEIRIEGSDEVTLSWFGADGKPRKSVPASVKEDNGPELKELRARVKEIKGLLSGQRYRLESLYLRDRSWPLEQWRERYLEHPLLAGMARRLIWNIGEVAAIPAGDGFVGAAGKPFEPAAEVTVSLWHPIDVVAGDVLAWRRRLAALEITQPFKQAHREIYVLTDAERVTATYSNRFAAHILRQHQFAALCTARQWRYTLQGDWDSHNFPFRHLEDRDLSILFDVEPAGPEYLSDMNIYNYVGSDRVFFRDNNGETLELADLPPLLFSELMRDVDLFVGVASIGADPEWIDRGPDAPFMDYWRGYSVAELTESARTRRAVLEELLPRLKIADVCELEDRFLKVQGKKRTYKIHLGSGNIQMEPNNQYLCIVPGRGVAGGEDVRLPFEGDGVLSIILSKAFLLAADDKITDKTILSQIGR